MHTAWPLRDVALKALDPPALVRFYTDFGFQIMEQSQEFAMLAAGNGFRLTLQSLPNGRRRPPLTAGLFHFAILVEDRVTLASFLRHAARHRWTLVGAADHLVSEALYFSDPEDNGIEVYADRSADHWQWTDLRVHMATLPLDLEALARTQGPERSGFPPRTRPGHMHLTVSDLDRSQEFYESLGMSLTANWGPFRFLSYDGYHHHLGINLAAGHIAAQSHRKFRDWRAFRCSARRSRLAAPIRPIFSSRRRSPHSPKRN